MLACLKKALHIVVIPAFQVDPLALDGLEGMDCKPRSTCMQRSHKLSCKALIQCRPAQFKTTLCARKDTPKTCQPRTLKQPCCTCHDAPIHVYVVYKEKVTSRGKEIRSKGEQHATKQRRHQMLALELSADISILCSCPLRPSMREAYTAIAYE